MIEVWVAGIVLLLFSWISLLLSGMSFEAEEDRVCLITAIIGIITGVGAVFILPI